MKNIVLTISCLLFSSGLLQAQNENFLFEDFRESTVVYKDGRTFKVDVNYDFLNGYFLFIDATDNNEKKEFGEPEKIAAIRVGDRTFLPSRGHSGAMEVLQFDPVVYVRLKGRVRMEDKKTAYGGRSATSSIDSYTSFNTGGKTHALEGDKFVLMGIDKTYQIVVGGKKKTFINEKQFLKLYSKNKEVLEKYIADNNVDFNDVDDVLNLCNYAFKLD